MAKDIKAAVAKLVKHAESIRREWDTADLDTLTAGKLRGDSLVKLRDQYTEAVSGDKAAEKWGQWCEKHVGRSYRSARVYVQISEGWEKVKNCKSIADALKVLAKPRGPKNTDKNKDTAPSIPTLTDQDRQNLTVSLSAAGISAFPDAVLAAVARCGFKIVRDATTSPTTTNPATTTTPKPRHYINTLTGNKLTTVDGADPSIPGYTEVTGPYTKLAEDEHGNIVVA